MMRSYVLLLLVPAVLLGGCWPSITVPGTAQLLCSSDEACPPQYLCLSEAGQCVHEESACIDPATASAAADGNQCTRGDDFPGFCDRGICLASRCGDGVIDSRRGERCDNGEENSNEAGAECSLLCRVPSCGDDILQSSESCDG